MSNKEKNVSFDLREIAEQEMIRDSARKQYLLKIPTAKEMEEQAKLKIFKAKKTAEVEKGGQNRDAEFGKEVFSFLKGKANHIEWFTFENRIRQVVQDLMTPL